MTNAVCGGEQHQAARSSGGASSFLQDQGQVFAFAFQAARRDDVLPGSLSGFGESVTLLRVDWWSELYVLATACCVRSCSAGGFYSMLVRSDMPTRA